MKGIYYETWHILKRYWSPSVIAVLFWHTLSAAERLRKVIITFTLMLGQMTCGTIWERLWS